MTRNHNSLFTSNSHSVKHNSSRSHIMTIFSNHRNKMPIQFIQMRNISSFKIFSNTNSLNYSCQTKSTSFLINLQSHISRRNNRISIRHCYNSSKTTSNSCMKPRIQIFFLSLPWISKMNMHINKRRSDSKSVSIIICQRTIFATIFIQN